MKFKVKEFNFQSETDGSNITRHMIVLCEGDELVAWTDFHKYVRDSQRIKKIHNSNRARFNIVTMFLNYVFFTERVASLADITADMCATFLQHYGMCTLESDTPTTHRSEATIKSGFRYLMDFLVVICKSNKNMKIKTKDLYEEKEVFSKKRRTYVKVRVPKIELVHNATVQKPIFRDIPRKAFDVIMDIIVREHRDILMLVVLCAFGGLRVGEACQVRRPDSKLGAGIRFNVVRGTVRNITIDLRREYMLRSDGVLTGKIKRHREQNIHPNFIPDFVKYYKLYVSYIKDKKYEVEFGALSINRSGKAFTTSAFSSAFKKAVAEAADVMLHTDDPELVEYAQLLQTNSLGAHSLRHFYTVQLVEMGEREGGVKYWRGDGSPESAITYLQNKSDPDKDFSRAAEAAFDYNMWLARKKNEELE